MSRKMKLTETCISAVGLKVVIAQKSRERPVTLSAVSGILGVSVSYLE